MAREPLAPLEERFLDVDGVQIYDRVCTVAGPSAAAIVHLHGFGVSGTYLEPTAVQLTERARHFIPDLPGTGRSGRPASPLDIPGSVRALIEYCDAVGLERATFVGNSLGCVTLVELAVAHPDRVDGIVLVSPAGGPNNQPLPKALGQMTIDGVREPFEMTRVATRDYLRFGVLQSLSLFRAMAKYPTLDRLELLDLPTLVILGRRDPLVDTDRVRRLFGGRPGMAAVVIDGAHALNFTRPETVAPLIAAQLDGVALTGTGAPDDSIEVLFDDR
jgi:pimeloyl-ACP methyl ester carboxylesterase